MTLKTLLGYVVSALLLFFAVLYALASVYMPIRIWISALLFLAGFGMLYFVWRRQPTKIVQKLEVPGRIKVQEIKCPNCSASIDIDQIKIVNGVPTVKCPYCGHVFEVTEEPKW
ncbi:hypothetical protein DRO45_03400 [Candidatus Bathyarchaeota archaeon]|nr:MAG: hypothetical protein DRO45_03400 [Candidatus Bathyarchaeota archaeon]